jgi:hypothetical protein
VTGNAVCEDGHVFQVCAAARSPSIVAKLTSDVGLPIRESGRRGSQPYFAETDYTKRSPAEQAEGRGSGEQGL